MEKYILLPRRTERNPQDIADFCFHAFSGQSTRESKPSDFSPRQEQQGLNQTHLIFSIGFGSCQQPHKGRLHPFLISAPCGVETCPPSKDMWMSLPRVSVNVTLFRNSQVTMTSCWSEWALNPMTAVLRRGDLDPETHPGRRPCGNGDGDGAVWLLAVGGQTASDTRNGERGVRRPSRHALGDSRAL